MRRFALPFDNAAIVAGAALLLPPLAVLAPLGIAALAGVAAALVLLRASFAERCWPPVERTTLLAIGLFVLWAILSAFWSLQPERSLAGALRVGIICLGGLILIGAVTDLDASQRRSVAIGLLLGGALGALLLAVNFATDIGINRLFLDDPVAVPVKILNRTAGIVAILCWPLALVVGRRWRAGGILILLAGTGFALTLFEPAVPLIAFAAALAVFGLALWRPRLAANALCVGVVALVLALPALPQLAPRLDTALTDAAINESSVSHRLEIWAFSTGRALERPLTGWGMATSRAIPGGMQNVPILGEPNADAPAIPLHPHNAFVQIWLETGLPALLLAGFIVIRVLRRLPQAVAGRRETAAALATATALLIVANLSYGIWQGWWLCFIWLTAALVTALTPRTAA
jgi:O-antigen ligase